jgi:NADH:ubiquinone oxidoreductase subunit F (NADH-binding)
MSKNLRGLSRRKGLNDNLFEKIINAGSSDSDTRDANLKILSGEYLIGESSVYSTNSFYDFLRPDHSDKKVFICDGSACLTSGKQEKLMQDLLKRFRRDEIGTVTCLGLCHTNGAFMFDRKAYTISNIDASGNILKNDKKDSNVLHSYTDIEKPVLLSPINDVSKYYRLIEKYINDFSEAIKEIELSGLRGRGGAGFPFSFKLKTAKEAQGNQKYIVCNADEGDPGAFSDKWLLEERPHSVLFGMLISGLIIGADTGVIYIRGEYPEAVSEIKKSIALLEEQQITGHNIFGSSLNFSFRVIEGAGAYICGEETSLLNSVEGLRPEVRSRPPFPSEYGLFGKPTLLSNVETFANLWYILNVGGKEYASIGTEKSSGTKLVSLDGMFNKPGLYEVKMGTPLNTLIYELGAGLQSPVKAFQIGGPLGGIVPVEKTADLTIDFESFSQHGFLLGHAGVVSIPGDFPMINYLKHLFEFTSKESCGKCFPCRIGSDRGLDLLERASEGVSRIDRALFNDLLETLHLGSLCALGGGLPLPVRNILQYFDEELDEFFTGEKS